MAPTACFVTASRHNVFFGELLDALADALASHGIAIERAVDFFPEPREDMAYVFVPHELLPLLMADARPDAEQLRRSVAVCTEQPGTHWFDEAAHAAQRASSAVDINRVGVAALRKLGVDARFLQLGYTPRWDRWHAQPAAPRPIDVTVLAGATPRRLQALAQCARQLAGRRTELRLPEALVPHTADSAQFVSGARKWELLASSRLLVNVHRGELGYFESQRAAEAICNGCVMLSEHSLGFEPLVPGEHFFSTSLASLDVVLEAALADESRLRRVRDAAYALLREQLTLERSAAVLAEAVAEAAAIPASTRRAARPPVPRPKPPNLPPPAWLALGHSPPCEDAVDEPERDAGLGGDDREELVERLGATAAGPPAVSVLVTVADEAASVARAVEMVALSDSDVELVIVDDGSTDGSDEHIRMALARAPWLSATLITRRRRGGLARARNRGVEQAAGGLVLVMDAQDAPHPPGAIGRLAGALERAPAAAFSYGLVEQDDASGPRGLAGHRGWDPATLRYGNFVATMPLLRRRALLEVGGYTIDPTLSGWEDLALWCEFAERGWCGAHLAEVVGRRDVGAGYPGGLDPRHSEAPASRTAWALLLDRYDCLSASVAV